MDKSNVFARKYRPTKLADLVGQESVVTTLTNAFESKGLYQCFIFGGNFGCGKTTTARILAAMENCENGPTLEPCGQCKMCRDIFAGESSDIKEVNAASDNGIEVVRNIGDFVHSRPLIARVKYVILDEAHRLTPQAMEAALKILEEPPEGVRFVLCTTEAQRFKGTIHSRAMPFRFIKVSWPQIAQHLKNVAKAESIQIDDAALKIAARMSDGSVRNSLRNLQMLVAFAGNKPIAAELAQQALGTVSDDTYFHLVDAILDKDASTAIAVVQKFFETSGDFVYVQDGLMEHLRTLLVLLSCQNTAGLLYLSEDEKKRYIHQLKRMSIHLVSDMISLLYDVARGVSINMSPQMLLEHFVLKSIFAVARIERQVAKQS